jgi:hypothetical protein
MDAPHPWNVGQRGYPSDALRDYVERAARINPVLEERLGWLHEMVTAALASIVPGGEPVALCRTKALPGFHIFYSDPMYQSKRSHHAHVDRPYAGVDWSDFEEVDTRRTLSFTLPIELPAGGGGLRIWDLDLSDATDWQPEVARDRLRAAGSRLHAYRVGRLLLHNGHSMHRIEPWEHVEGERRVTLQGHGIFADGAWRLYW